MICGAITRQPKCKVHRRSILAGIVIVSLADFGYFETPAALKFLFFNGRSAPQIKDSPRFGNMDADLGKGDLYVFLVEGVFNPPSQFPANSPLF